MNHTHDPIMDSTPLSKKRRLNSEEALETSKALASRVWDSDNDSGDNLNEDDFEPATIATIPLASQKRKMPSMPASSGAMSSSYTTQPTQPIRKSPEVQVGRSSPVVANLSSPRTQPEPIKRAPFAKPGMLASIMAPPGTSFRVPPGVRTKPVVTDLDSDDDPPVHHSDDEDTQTQGLHSKLKPTNFQKGGRALNSSAHVGNGSHNPNRASPVTSFTSLLNEFQYHGSPVKSTNGITSAQGRTNKDARSGLPGDSKVPSSTAATVKYLSIQDITDRKTQASVAAMMDVLGGSCTVQQCVDALRAKHGNTEDAMFWLTEQNEAEELRNALALSSTKKGVAQIKPTSKPTAQSNSLRPAAKQEVRAPTRTIAEKYGTSQKPIAVDLDSEEELPKPRRRLVQGRKAAARPTPPSSPPKAAPVIEIDSASESDPELAKDSDSGLEHNDGDSRLLKFLNECTASELSELCGQPETVAEHILQQRPFDDLDRVRSIPAMTKSGKKSNRARPIGDKVVDDCLEMLTGYNAVDDLVKQCEKIAAPLQTALQEWGVGDADGELHLVNLDEAHDSGIGTPTSSCAPDETPSRKSRKGNFISQPQNMNADFTLKNYQLVGINWLNLLYAKKLSCILADDMGLGKTCQIIAFLSYLQLQKVDGVHLIIVPGSTLENWLREFERFAPQLNVRPYYGAQKEREMLRYELEEEFAELDVIVTTYEMAAAKDDNKFLRKYGPFSVCVYDEAHALRNPKSNRYQQLVRIRADFRVLLTGTPLQNNLQELIAILAFIMPSLFQDKRDDLEVIFKHKATTKDATHAAMLSSERIARARSMMTPFILRRKKEQVLDLPAKHRRVEYCDMTTTQATFYADVLNEARQFYSDKAAGAPAKSGASSNVLMALRKVAIHPLLSRRLYDAKKIDKIVSALSKSVEFGDNSRRKIRDYITGEAGISLQGGDFALHYFCAQREGLSKFALQRQEWMDSGKVALFKELITKFAENGDRVLVFSQFTTVMDILEAVLETLAIKFMRLDGSTKMDVRQDMIDQFSSDTSIPVFMLSTKAGGAGINLAAANKVIIFDSGFNPQDDIQAENRAHRVGQTREVEVIRLVTRGTIEEQIHALGESKLALDERVAGEVATEDKQAEKAGEQLVQKMFIDNLQQEESSEDLKDAFKKGLEGKGVKVASKQAQF